MAGRRAVHRKQYIAKGSAEALPASQYMQLEKKPVAQVMVSNNK